MLDALSSAASSVANTVSSAVGDVGLAAACKWTEIEIKKYTGYDIEVTTKDIPDHLKDWVIKTGMNSLCVDDTWSFLEKSTWNQRKLDKWATRNIKKIIVTVDEKPDEDMRSWVTAEVDWKEGDTFMEVSFLPYAFTWSSSNAWPESGSHTWWNLCDEIVFGLQLYQLPGKCFYKSDWLENFEDIDPDGLLPNSKKKFTRWFQFRHWIIYWYSEAQWGWNYQWTEKPPKMSNGLDFDLSSVLSLPSMPSMSMPSVKLPSLPGMPSMPSLPSLPSLSMPSLSAPSLSMPSLSAPSLPSLPERKKRAGGRWDAHGYIEMNGMKVKAKGKTLVLSNITYTNFWETKTTYENETLENARLELTCTDDEQALSWQESLIAGGAEEGEVGGCCTVA